MINQDEQHGAVETTGDYLFMQPGTIIYAPFFPIINDFEHVGPSIGFFYTPYYVDDHYSVDRRVSIIILARLRDRSIC